MKKLIIIAVVAIVLIGGGIKGFMWWSVKSDVDTALENMKVKADISYGGVGTSDGGVVLKDAVIKPAGSAYEFKVRKFTVAPRVPEDFETAMRLYGKNVYPAELMVDIRGLKLELDKPLPRMFVKTPVEKISLGNMLAWGCGKSEAIDAEQLKAMGYDSLTFNANFDYSYDQMKGVIKGEFSLEAEGLANATGRFTSRLPSMSSVGVQTGLVNNKFDALSVQVNDAGFQKKWLDFCTKETGLLPNAFVDAHQNRMKMMLERFGIKFSDSIYQGLKNYHLKGGKLTFSLGVPADTEFTRFIKMKPEDVAGILKLAASVNGEELQALGVGINMPQFSSAVWQYSYEGSEWRTFVPPPPKKTTRVVKKKHQPEWHRVSVSALPNFVGKNIRATTDGGSAKEGKLKGIKGRKIYLSRQMGSGEGVFHVFADEIKTLEVLY